MTYYITCIKGIYAYEDFNISEGQTREVRKEVYDYCNKHFGTSGRFTFRTEDVKPKVEVKVKTEEVKKPTKRSKRSTEEG